MGPARDHLSISAYDGRFRLTQNEEVDVRGIVAGLLRSSRAMSCLPALDTDTTQAKELEVQRVGATAVAVVLGFARSRCTGGPSRSDDVLLP